MSLIDEKTKVPLSLVITLLGLTVSIVSIGAVSHYRLTQLEKEWESYKAREETNDKTSHYQAMQIQKLELTLFNMNEKLDSINKKLDRMERK